MRQTKLASSLVNFRAHYKIVGLFYTIVYVHLFFIDITYLPVPVYFKIRHQKRDPNRKRRSRRYEIVYDDEEYCNIKSIANLIRLKLYSCNSQ